MTLNNAPWALDGARTNASLARLSTYAVGGDSDGVVSVNDLKVSALTVPGVGVTIGHGAALVINRYQANPNEVYVVNNAGAETLQPTDMPPASASAQSHLVCVTIGDPEFSQVGHPWMPSTGVPEGEEETFQYVRFFIIPNVPSSTKRFSDLGLNYPAYALARLDVPANTTTIQSNHIVDLRKIANPRNTERIEHITSPSDNFLNGNAAGAGAWEAFPSNMYFDLEIPTWASRAKITGFVEGLVHLEPGEGSLRVAFADGGVTTNTSINESAPVTGVDRKSYNVGGEIAIPESYRGTTRRIRMEGRVWVEAHKGMLKTDTYSSAQIRVRLEEEAT